MMYEKMESKQDSLTHLKYEKTMSDTYITISVRKEPGQRNRIFSNQFSCFSETQDLVPPDL